MPQRFGDAEFTGNVRVRGRLIVDRGTDTNGWSDAIAGISKRVDELSVAICATPDENSVMAIANLRDDLDAQRAVLNIVQQELGTVAASIHKTQNAETPALDQLRASVSQLAASNEKTVTILEDVGGSSVIDELGVVRRECRTLRSMIDELRHEVDTGNKEGSATAAGGCDEEVLRLSQTVNELSAHVKNKGVDFRRSNVQMSDMTERMIQTAIADLRDEFIYVQRDNSTPLTLTKQYESAKKECEELREELTGLRSQLNTAESRFAAFREESARDNERMELQRRQVATIVAELDRIKTMMRAS